MFLYVMVHFKFITILNHIFFRQTIFVHVQHNVHACLLLQYIYVQQISCFGKRKFVIQKYMEMLNISCPIYTCRYIHNIPTCVLDFVFKSVSAMHILCMLQLFQICKSYIKSNMYVLYLRDQFKVINFVFCTLTHTKCI
jgi:hypothetical protein